MVIVYGTRFYGKVKAAGSSFLATQFVHIYYVPLIPIGTHLILEENAGGSFKGIKSELQREVDAGRVHARVGPHRGHRGDRHRPQRARRLQ